LIYYRRFVTYFKHPRPHSIHITHSNLAEHKFCSFRRSYVKRRVSSGITN